MNKANKYGYNTSNEWINMGQGSPNIEEPLNININLYPKYSEINGIKSLRNKISNFYNYFYDIKSDFNNINISNGGRLCLNKLFFLLKNKTFGCISPDYTAYYELLQYNDINYIELNNTNELHIPMDNIIKNCKKNHIEVLILSNPKNPTGYCYNNSEMKKLVNYLKENNIYVIIDEIYSLYIYDDINSKPLSICNSIKNIDNTNIIVINGLTKGWKVPGLRLCWILANKKIIQDCGSITSFFDGGPNILSQQICLKNKYLDIEYIQNLYLEIKKEYNEKRIYLINELKNMGFIIEKDPISTFYIYAATDNLPKDIQNDD